MWKQRNVIITSYYYLVTVAHTSEQFAVQLQQNINWREEEKSLK